MKLKKLILIACAGSMAGWASNNATMLGPVTGYIFDAQLHAIRPMMGIPGAAYLGAPILSGSDAAAVSPDGSAALVVEAGQLKLYRNLGTAHPMGVLLNGSFAADSFAWASSGTAAAVYSSAAKQALVFGDLAGSNPAGGLIDLSSLMGKVAAMVYDGQRIMLAVSSPIGGGVYAATEQSAPQLLASAVSPTGIALAGADLYFADSQAGQIWQVRNYATKPAPVVFAADASISKPSAVQVSADGARLYVANAGNRTLGVYDLAARSPLESLSVNVSATALDRFGDPSVFVLNTGGEGSGILYVLSDQLDRRAVYFVPDTGSGRRPPPLRYKPQ